MQLFFFFPHFNMRQTLPDELSPFKWTYRSSLGVLVSLWSWYFWGWRARRSAYPGDRLCFCPPVEQIAQDKLTQYLHMSEIACLETDGADIWQLRTDVHKLAVGGFTNCKLLQCQTGVMKYWFLCAVTGGCMCMYLHRPMGASEPPGQWFSWLGW